MNKITMFEGQEVKVKTDKGVTLINLVCTAKSCGLIGVSTKVGGKYEFVRWDRIKEKLKLIGKNCVDKPSSKEIYYILDEIENTDDRNTIYMSSWLSKRLALECHSDKAMRYKNFLVTLDEARENGQLRMNNGVLQVLSTSLPTLNQILTNLVPAMNNIENQVNSMSKLMYDQSVIYDQDREDLKSLIGFRAVNTKRLSDKLKEELSEKLGITVTANTNAYRKAKGKIFKEFGVVKWEDIPASKYNAVHAFIEEVVEEII
ncbi:hypothetical protein [Clostridium sp. KNHs214]|uniref:hypothetical protein n=1 Tax=Clostridium sp. KNHs214 TaxID=1540257 RepID=UPI000552ADF2|nr:hypothetical protein [Clostridium sp. KNHs214]